MIVVTGGAGFIGSNLIAGLASDTREPIIVCDSLLGADKWRNLAKHPVEDVIAPPDLFDWLSAHALNVSAVFHMGAISSTTATDADTVIATNVRLSLDLWDWCGHHGVRLIYASSASVYGDGSAGFADEQTPESMARLHPLNLYGWSKLLVDRRISRLAEHVRIRPPQWCGLRFFNVYGPNEYHKEGQLSVVHAAYQQIRDTGGCRLFKSHRPDYADGAQLRDFVWVGDCVDVMRFLYRNPEISGLFNVGTGEANTFNALAEATFAALDLPVRVDYIDMPAAVRAHYQYHTQADIQRLRAQGYAKPFTPLAEGVRMYVRQFLSADDPYR